MLIMWFILKNTYPLKVHIEIFTDELWYLEFVSK